VNRADARSSGSDPRPLPIFCGHHRCGTTWIYRVLREVCEDHLGLRVLQARGEAEFGSDLASVRARQGVDVVSYINADFRFVRGVEVAGVHVVRDPRDLLVSAYFAHAFSHPTDGWPELAEFRRTLARRSPAEGLRLELDFCQNVMEDMRGWPRHVPGIVEMRFEELIEEPLAGFAEMFARLGLEQAVESGALATVVGAHSFERLSGGRARGEVDRDSHYRSGLAGEWRQRFDARLAREFEARYGDLLRRYGYEGDGSWPERLGAAPELDPVGRGVSDAHD